MIRKAYKKPELTKREKLSGVLRNSIAFAGVFGSNDFFFLWDDFSPWNFPGIGEVRLPRPFWIWMLVRHGQAVLVNGGLLFIDNPEPMIL